MTTLADAAASIDATLAAAGQHQRRLHRRDLANERLTRRRATLAAVRAAHQPSPDDLVAATAIGYYATNELAPVPCCTTTDRLHGRPVVDEGSPLAGESA